VKLPKLDLKKPQMKMSTPKTPAFLTDLYYDLRDRRLLLPLALVLVAIAAVPFLLGSKPKPVPAPPAGGIAAAVGSGGGGSQLTVVEAQPGLRDYHKRLKHRTPTDPFTQRFTSLPPSAQVETTQSGGGASEGSSEGSVTVTEGTTTEVTETGGGGAPAGEGGGETTAQDYEFVIDAQIAHSEKTADGSEKLSEWKARHDVPALTQLPSEKAPVVTLLGGNFRTQGIIFLVAHTVKSISGDFRCANRTEVCELLEVAQGALLEYVYEPTGVRYAIKVTNAAVIPKRRHRSSRSSRAAYIFPNGAPGRPHSFSK
jgi:hypothetical protein